MLRMVITDTARTLRANYSCGWTAPVTIRTADTVCSGTFSSTSHKTLLCVEIKIACVLRNTPYLEIEEDLSEQ